MPNKKVLIISLAAGVGHVKAAAALNSSAAKFFPNLECKHIDLYDYISYPFKKAAISSYVLMVKSLPELWGFFYKKTDKEKTVKSFNTLTKRLKQINAIKFYSEIKNFSPDIIICTHFLPADLVLNPPEKYDYKIPVAVVLTDYDLHNFWLNKGISHYFVATEKMKWKIVKRNFDSGHNVTASGIPAGLEFYEPKNKNLLRESYKIRKDNPCVLLMSGGQGMSKSDKVLKQLFNITNIDFTVVSIAGNNKQLKNRIDKIDPPKNIKVISLGWTDKMPDLLKLCDLVISKPGGLTTTECLISKIPILAIDPIPGQEEANAHFILENNFGKVAETSEDLCYYVEKYLENKIPHNKLEYKDIAAKIILEKILEI